LTSFPIPDCNAVLELIAGYLATDLGHRELERIGFCTVAAEVRAMHARLGEAVRWLQRRGGFDFAALGEDPRPCLEQCRLPGIALGASELLQVRGYLDAAAGLREHLGGNDGAARQDPGDRDLWPGLAALGEAIPVCRGLRRALHAALLPNGDVADDASPELASLRRQRLRQRQAIESSLARHLQQLGGEGVLQQELVTVRNDRFVLPVRTDLRRRAPGVVHGASSTGQTVFVEPLETIELNNDYIRLREEEQAEIHRILLALTEQVGAEGAAIAAGAAACGILELEAAKARFAADYAAGPAEWDEALVLEDARHPVLVATLRGNRDHAVVPLSLRLAAQRVLVVSGPNTGGKTVVLKTVGMAAWMAQCGLPVCARVARLPVFDYIAADIGDVQSLEHNLSTFSSHLVRIREVLERATADSLVLLDELGTATNAAEGAALATEIAETLAQRRAWTLISTHHDSLKAWASAHPDRVANGSVAVDPVTLAPSYIFRMGVPGLSAGLDMAARIGLPPEVVSGARARLTESERQAGEYLQKLQQNLALAERQVRDLQQREAAVSERERDIETHDRAYVQRHMASLRAEMDRRLASFTRDAEAQWRQALESLQAELTSAQKRKIAVAAARLKRETAEGFAGGVGSVLADPGGAGGPAPAAVDPQPGDRVRLRSLSQPANVLRCLGGGKLEIEAGALRMRISLTDVAEILAATRPQAHARTPETPVMAEINLIGMRMEEATEKLEKFLDQAILAETSQIRIVHGAGFGVLRRAVADTLRAHPQVAAFSHPPQNQGGQGVTIAEMK